MILHGVFGAWHHDDMYVFCVNCLPFKDSTKAGCKVNVCVLNCRASGASTTPIVCVAPLGKLCSRSDRQMVRLH